MRLLQENEPQGSSHVVERIRRHTEIKFPIDVKVEKTAKKLITELLAWEVTQRLGAQVGCPGAPNQIEIDPPY